MNVRLDLTPTGCFVAVPSTVGTTEEEVLAMTRGELPKERLEAILTGLGAAAHRLNAMEIGGSC